MRIAGVDLLIVIFFFNPDFQFFATFQVLANINVETKRLLHFPTQSINGCKCR